MPVEMMITKEDLHTNAIVSFCADFRDKKSKLSKLGILPKSGIS